MHRYLQGLLFRNSLASIGSHAVGVLPEAVQLLAQGSHQLLSALLLLHQRAALLLRLIQLRPAQSHIHSLTAVFSLLVLAGPNNDKAD